MGIQQSQPVVVALLPHALQAFCKEPLNTLYLKRQKFEMRGQTAEQYSNKGRT